MKRIGDLWGDVVSMKNLSKAADLACNSRRNKREVASFQIDRDVLLKKLRLSLLDHTFRSSEYKIFQVHENGKVRDIANLPLYPDRILHWAVSLVVEPIVDGRLIDQTHASRVGHGIHTAMSDVSRYIDSDPKVTYCLKTDVKKFFPSIDKNVAKAKFRTVIKDREVLWLLDRIIDDYEFSGIPIGNRTSPMIANLFLSEMDHVMKERFHCHYYVRYMDDVIVLGYSKQWLHKIRKTMSTMLGEIGLTMKENWQVFPINSRGIDFVGFRIFTNHTLIRKSIKKRIVAASKRLSQKVESGRMLDKHDIGTIASYNGLMCWCDAFNLYRSTFWKVERKNRFLIAENEARPAFRSYFAFVDEICDGTVII